MSELNAETELSVRDVLAAHFVMWQAIPEKGKPPGEWVCSCGLKFGFSDTAINHVTEEVGNVHERGFEAGYEQACDDLGVTSAAIAAQALREAADALDAEADILAEDGTAGARLSYINCTRMDAKTLRARADDLSNRPAEQPTEVWECGPHANAWNGHDARCRRITRPAEGGDDRG